MNFFETRYGGRAEDARSQKPTDVAPIEPESGLTKAVTVIADIAANGIPIGKNARLVAKVEDMNHGEYKAKPAAVVGISFEF